MIGTIASGTGCASERDPINKVQPAAIDKSFFLGADLKDFKDDPEFRTKTYNIDSPANTSNYSGTIGSGSAVDRVRWEVTEDWLFARRSYQEAPGSDSHGLPRILRTLPDGTTVWEFQGPADGTIIAAYKITKHFDIRRDYNASTGEENNVIVENDTDRPWQERQYMRIDWSQNQAESTSGDTSWVFGEGTSATAIQYSTSNVTDIDAPVFEDQYFDITNKYQLSSEVNPEFGVSECVILGFFNGSTTWDCSPTEVKVRHSFQKLTGNEDFEPFEESFAPRDIVGNWNNAGNNFNKEEGAPITSWDPQYGYVDANTKTFYQMHNIWQKSHQAFACTDNTDKDKDGTADACANGVTGYQGASGSQCDTIIGKCTLPVRDRSIKTTGYWINVDAPPEILDQVAADGKTVTLGGPVEESTITWNQLMRSAVATRREVECRRTKDGDRAACHAQFFDTSAASDMVAFGGWGIQKVLDQKIDNGLPLVTTCHNPIRAYDQPSCGKVGEVIRLGDIRKNYAIYWPYASRAGYGGLATIGADPLTGEMLGVTATTMMRSATFAAAQQRDIIAVALGDTKIDDIITGAPASKYADLVKNGKVTSKLLSTGKTQAEIDHRVAEAAFSKDQLQTTLGVTLPASNTRIAGRSAIAQQVQNIKRKQFLSPTSDTMTAADNQVQALVSQLDKSPLRENIANRGLRKIAAASADKSSVLYNVINSLGNQDSTAVEALFNKYQAYLGRKGVCFQDETQAAGAGSIYQPQLAGYFKNLYGSMDAKTRGAAIYQDLLREATKGIAFHEIGHSLGMRHNFSSSWDSMNYSPQYWQLRTNEGQSTATCMTARTGGADTCMGPRYLDPETDDEQGLAGESRPGIEYFGNTSTMEYQIERFGETVGAGTYDLHFMETVYGRTLETFDASQVAPADQQNFAVLTLSQSIPDDLVFDPTKGYGMHYTKVANQAKVFNPTRDCRAATPEEKASAKWRIVHGKVCSTSPKNHLAYQDMTTSEISFDQGGVVTPIGVDGVRWNGTDETGKKLVRWQFRYGEDYSAGGWIHAKTFDSGADIYEITANVAKRFDLTYPWQYFRRQRIEFAWWGIPSGINSGTFSRLRGYHWTTSTDISGVQSASELADDDQRRPDVMASAEMFNFLQRVILLPEPGDYGPSPESAARTPKRPGALPILDVSATPKVVTTSLGIIDGRYVQVAVDNARGGSYDYNEFITHAGWDEEKMLAIRQLVDSRPTLSTISRENALDGRDPYISFRTDTPWATDRLIGGILAEDWETIAPSTNPNETGGMVNMDLLTRSSTAATARPAGSSILFPNLGYSNQIGGGIYALLYSRFSTDLTLASKMRIRFTNDTGPVIADAVKQAFTDPVTGFQYVATKFGNETIQGRQVETGVGSRMLQHANELLSAVYAVDTDPVTGAPIVDAFGQPKVTLVSGQPVIKGSAADIQNLRRYVGLLDGMRQVGNIFGGGPLGGGGDGSGDE